MNNLTFRIFAGFMNRILTAFLLAVALLSLNSCKTEFEKVRTSGDTERILSKANEYYEKGKYEKAQTLYELVVNALRGDPRLQEAYFKYANSYFQSGQYILSSYYFKNYADTYTVSDNRDEAQFMEAMSYVKLSPTFRLDQKYTNKAIAALEQYANTYPQSDKDEKINSLLTELRAKLEQKAFSSATLYYDMKQYQSAVNSFTHMLQDYPDSKKTQLIRYRIADSHIKLADNSIVKKRRERYNSAIDAIKIYLKKYPKGKYSRSLKQEKSRIVELLKNNDEYVRY